MDMDHSLPIDADPIQSAAAPATGRRPETPQFTDDPMLDRLYGVTLALVAELAVTRTRLDSVERLLARRQLVGTAEIEEFVPDAAEAEARSRLQAEYLERTLRALGGG
jgi:hypothetical protein